MKSFLIFGLVVIFAVIVQKTEQSEKSCKAAAADFARRQIRGISKCTKSMTFKDATDRSKKMNCIIRCVLIQEYVLNADGQATLEGYNNFLTTEFPPAELPHFNRTFWNCMTDALQTGFKTLEEDEYCTGYEPFIKCLMGAVPGLCNWS